MSGRDAFDGEIERLFARPPVLRGERDFVDRVERRLNQRWGIRAGVLTAAGIAGGIFAVRETLAAGLGEGLARVTETSETATQAAQSLDLNQILAWLESGSPGLASTPAMPLFWLVSVGVIVAALFTGLQANQA